MQRKCTCECRENTSYRLPLLVCVCTVICYMTLLPKACVSLLVVFSPRNAALRPWKTTPNSVGMVCQIWHPILIGLTRARLPMNSCEADSWQPAAHGRSVSVRSGNTVPTIRQAVSLLVCDSTGTTASTSGYERGCCNDIPHPPCLTEAGAIPPLQASTKASIRRSNWP